MNAKRNPRFTRLGFFVFALLAALASFDQALAGDDTNTTKRAPDFALKDTDGRVVKPEDFAGKVLIVTFVVTWDEPSLEQIKVLSELVRKHGDKEVAILAMAIEKAGPPTTKAYVEQEHPGFPFLVANYETIRAFGGVTAVPTTFVIDKERKIIRQHVGVTDLKVFEAALKPASSQ